MIAPKKDCQNPLTNVRPVHHLLELVHRRCRPDARRAAGPFGIGQPQFDREASRNLCWTNRGAIVSASSAQAGPVVRPVQPGKTTKSFQRRYASVHGD